MWIHQITNVFSYWRFGKRCCLARMRADHKLDKQIIVTNTRTLTGRRRLGSSTGESKKRKRPRQIAEQRRGVCGAWPKNPTNVRSGSRIFFSTFWFLIVVVVVNGSYSAAPYSSPDRECITKVKIKQRQSTQKKVSFQFALERANSVCFTNCCGNTVPYDWPGHRDGRLCRQISFLYVELNNWCWSLSGDESEPDRYCTPVQNCWDNLGTVQCGLWTSSEPAWTWFCAPRVTSEALSERNAHGHAEQ